MRSDSTLPVCLLALGWMTDPAAGARIQEPEAVLTVRLYDHAHLPNKTLAGATENAIRVFRQAGVELRVVDCSLSEEERAKHPACDESLNSFSFSLRILPRHMAERFTFPAGTLGFAAGSRAYVFFHSVQALSRWKAMPQSVILGHVVAHELGHLLLGEGHVSATGLMSPRLCDMHFARATQGMLLFDRREAERIRARLQEQQVQAKR